MVSVCVLWQGYKEQDGSLGGFTLILLLPELQRCGEMTTTFIISLVICLDGAGLQYKAAVHCVPVCGGAVDVCCEGWSDVFSHVDKMEEWIILHKVSRHCLYSCNFQILDRLMEISNLTCLV